MIKRLLVCLLQVLLALSLCGCWNYRGLDEVNIVVGIAVDFDKEEKEYKMSYEVADLGTVEKDQSIKGRIITAEGKTLFDAARNAKRKEKDRLFFGSSYVLVISQEIAREEGIFDAIEWFLRDGECRETMCVSISQEETAVKVLEKEEKMSGIMSVIIHDIIMEDKSVSASTIHMPIYEVYSLLKSKANSAVLPAMRKTKNGDLEVTTVNGSAVFKGDKLVGFLTPEESKYALFAWDKLKSGILTMNIASQKTDDISLEIFQSSTKKNFSYDQGQIKVIIESSTDVAIAENHSELNVMDEQIVKNIEEEAGKMIEENIKAVIEKVQKEYQADVFGFSDMIFKRDLKLWKQLELEWEEIFPDIEVEVTSKVHVVNSGFTK